MKPMAIGDDEAPAELRSRLYDAQYDFVGPVPLRKSYIVAATPRCGSNLLCTLMWQTGVLGAPAEYWNYVKRQAPKQRIMGIGMMERLEATSPIDYLTKLIACRTSKNGVFGVKLLFRRFQQAQPALLQMLQFLESTAPLSWIHILREDLVAQAVSLAKGLQTGVFTSRRQMELQQAMPVTYDRNLIADCLKKIEAQNRGWRQWFEANDIVPHIVPYEKLVADKARTIAGILEFCGVQNDEPDHVIPRSAERQGDSTNKEWVARFRRELEAVTQGADATVAPHRPLVGVEGTEAEEHATPGTPDGSSRFFEKRRRDRCMVIIAGNRELLQNARILDIYCGRGEWSLAALDAGAKHVLGLENRWRPIEKANKFFAERGVKAGTYSFGKAKIPAELESFPSGAFDVVVCQDFSAIAEPYYFFEQLRRLQPRHVILDTAVSPNRKQPAAFFKLALFRFGGSDGEMPREAKRPLASVVAIPNHGLIDLLSDYFGFSCRLIDWNSVGISNWAGLDDYQDNRRHSYVLSRF